jgi:hypothetical protein
MFRTAPVAAPLAIAEAVHAELEEEVAAAELPVSEGPNDADTTV